MNSDLKVGKGIAGGGWPETALTAIDKVNALQSDLRTLAEALLLAHKTLVDDKAYGFRPNTYNKVSPAITLAQGILEEKS